MNFRTDILKKAKDISYLIFKNIIKIKKMYQ